MITVQLSDKALQTILRKQVEPKLPDIHFFKRPINLQFQNLLAGKPVFSGLFKKQFEARAAELVTEKLSLQPLNLLIEAQENAVRLKLFQSTDLHLLLPYQFKESFPTDFVYFDVSIGKSFMIHQCALTDDKEKALGLTRIFILIAYDTLNHLKTPNERVLRTHPTRQQVSKMKMGEGRVEKKTSNGIIYFYPKVYEYLNPVHKVDKISRKPIRQHEHERFFLKPEWERRGHWRRVFDRETGEVKRRIWIEKSHVVIPEEKLKTERTIRISNI